MDNQDLNRTGNFHIVYQNQISNKAIGQATLREAIQHAKSDKLYPRLSLWEQTKDIGCVQLPSSLFK